MVFGTVCGRLRHAQRVPTGFVHGAGPDACTNALDFARTRRRREKTVPNKQKEVRRGAPMARLAWVMLTALSAALPVHQQRLGPSHIASFQCTQPSAPRYRRALLMARPCSPLASRRLLQTCCMARIPWCDGNCRVHPAHISRVCIASKLSVQWQRRRQAL